MFSLATAHQRFVRVYIYPVMSSMNYGQPHRRIIYEFTGNSILNSIARKYKIHTSKEHLSEDVNIQDVKFKYRTYNECIRILYKTMGNLQEA